MIYRLNGIIFDIKKQITIGDIQIAAGDLLKRPEQWLSLGITSEADPIYPDLHLYTWVYDYTPNSSPAIIISPKDPAIIALEDAIAQDEVDLVNIKGQATVKSFFDKTPAQIDTYFNGVTTIAGCVLALRILAKAVLILGRRILR